MTAIDHIITNSYLQSNIRLGIIKTDISDHFPIILATSSTDSEEYPKFTEFYKRKTDSDRISKFEEIISNTNWTQIEGHENANDAYDQFLQKFLIIYDDIFPKVKVKMKKLLSPWITSGLRKSSRRKQKLYEKFLKKRNLLNFKQI